jgi:hypothetical protein
MSKAHLIALMSMAAMADDWINSNITSRPPTPEEIARFKREKKERERDLNLSKGLKEWTIKGITVFAINEKNAIRKVNKILNQKT